MRQSKCSPALSDAVTKHFQGMLRFDRYHAAIAAVCCVFISMASVFGVTVLPNLPSGGGSTFAVGRLSSGVCYYGSEREGDNSPALHEGAEFAGYDDWYSYDLHWGSWKDVDLNDYKGPDFSESRKSSSLVTYTPGYCAHPIDGGRRCLAHSYPTIKRNYDQEDAEAHERYVDSICSAARVGRILRMVDDARFEAKRHH